MLSILLVSALATISAAQQSCTTEGFACKGISAEGRRAVARDAAQEDSMSLKMLQLSSSVKHRIKEKSVEHSASFRYVDKPMSLRLKDIQASNLDTSVMIDDKVNVSWLGGKEVHMYAFPASLDRGVSVNTSYGKLFEDDKIANFCQKWGGTGTGNFLDVGANIGSYSIPMSSCLAGKGEVIAVEAVPSIAAHLKASIMGNQLPNIELYPYAVGSVTDGDSVSMEIDSVNKGHSSIGSLQSVYEKGGFETTPMTTLDAMLAENPAMTMVRAMKMDVEGFEGRALFGAQHFFTNYAPCYLQVELCASWLETAGTPIDVVFMQLVAAGYDIDVDAEMQARGPDCKRDERNRCIRDIFIQQKNLEACLARVEDAVAATLPKH